MPAPEPVIMPAPEPIIMQAPQPVYTLPAVQAPEPIIMPAPEPVIVQAPPVVVEAPPPAMAPVAGPVHQVKGVGVTQKVYEQATTSIHNTTTVQTSAVAPPQYVTGQSYEVEGATQTLNFDQEQMVPGQTHTNTVEIQTVQEIPEMQIRELFQEVPQVQTVPVEKIVQQVVQVPKVVTQKRVSQRTVEMVVDVPVPMMVEEVVHVP